MAQIITIDETSKAKAKLDSLSLFEVGLLLSGLDCLIEVEEHDEEEHGYVSEALKELKALRTKLGRGA